MIMSGTYRGDLLVSNKTNGRQRHSKQPSVKAHGLDGHLVQPDWPPLRLEEVNALLRRFPSVRKAERILSFSPRPFSAASVVATPAGKIFVKRHHRSVRTPSALLEEHNFLAYLNSRTPLVKSPLRDEYGETAIAVNEWTYEVHLHGDGIDLYGQAQSWTPFLTTTHARNAGRALAKLHMAAAGYAKPPRMTSPLITSFSVFSQVDPWPVLSAYVAQRPGLAAYLGKRDWLRETRQAFESLHDKLRDFLPLFQPVWTHNDLHASNLLWSDDSADARVTDIFDFGLCDCTTPLHDVATSIERAVEWLEIEDTTRDPYRLDQIDAFLAGYEQFLPLSRNYARGLVALLPLVHAEFALSEIDYFSGVLQSQEKADVAYRTYFLGHARWFSTDAGKRLTSHLQHWAESHATTTEPRDQLIPETGKAHF